jgi:symplekin
MEIQPQICQNMTTLVPTITNTDYFLTLIKTFPEGSEDLILSVITSLMGNKDVSLQVAETTKQSYVDRKLDVRFLIIIIHTLKKDEVIEQLPILIKSLDTKNPVQTELVKNVFLKLVDVTTENDEESCIMTPSELLITIHNFDEGAVPVSKQIEAITVCFRNPLVFKQEVFAVVLQQLIDQVRLPVLILRTMIQSVTS